MNTLLAVPLLAFTLFAAGVVVSCALAVVRGSPRTGCPCCGYGGRPAGDRRCSECGRTIGQATRAWWWRILLRALGSILLGSASGLASLVALNGVAALPSAILLQLADPFADPQSAAGSIASLATFELQDRIVRGELTNDRLEPLLIRGIDAALGDGRLLVSRPTWPTDEPVRIMLNRDTLNELRSGAKLELVIVAPDGQERVATSWGGISRSYARPGESWTWRDPTIALPDSVRDGDSVRFAMVLRHGDGSEAYRRDMTLPIARATSAAEVVTPIDDPLFLERLRAALRIRFSPVPREGKPNAAVIAWLEEPLDLGEGPAPTGRAVALRITIDHLEEPAVHLEETVLVRDLGGLLTPTQTAPLSFEASPVPARLGRCRIRVRGDASAALRALRESRYVGGEIEFEQDLSPSPAP